MNAKRLTILLSVASLSILEAVVVSSAIENADGSFTYSYTVDNSLGVFDVSFFSLEFDYEIALRDWNPADLSSGGSVTVPLQDPTTTVDDWFAADGIPFTGQFAQDFFTNGPQGEGDVLVGESLSGFSFTSAIRPGEVEFTEFSANGASVTGVTIGPVVPEPSSVALILLSLPLLARRQRRLATI